MTQTVSISTIDYFLIVAVIISQVWLGTWIVTTHTVGIKDQLNQIQESITCSQEDIKND